MLFVDILVLNIQNRYLKNMESWLKNLTSLLLLNIILHNMIYKYSTYPLSPSLIILVKCRGILTQFQLSNILKFLCDFKMLYK